MDDNKNKKLQFYDRSILIIIALFTSFLIVLEIFGKKVIWGWEIDFAWVSSVLLLTIIIHFLISSFKMQNNSLQVLNSISVSQTNIVESIRGVEKRKFDTITDVDAYVAKRIKEAKYSVLDLNWQDFRTSSPSHSQQNRTIIDDEIDKSIKYFCKRRRKTELNDNSNFRNCNLLLLIVMR